MRYAACEPPDRFESLQLVHLPFQSFAFPAILGIPELALNSRNQACEIRLHDVILSPDSHSVSGRIFANRAGNENEWNLDISRSYHFQGFGPRKLRHGMVRDDDVPFLIESSRHAASRVHALRVAFVPALPKKLEQECGIIFRVLDYQNSNRDSHLSSPRRRRLVQNQPIESKLADRFAKLVEVHWLANITVGANTITGDAILLFVRGCQDHDRQKLRPFIGAQT